MFPSNHAITVVVENLQVEEAPSSTCFRYSVWYCTMLLKSKVIQC